MGYGIVNVPGGGGSAEKVQTLETEVSQLKTEVAGKAASADLTAHTENRSNPHGVTAEQVGALPVHGLRGEVVDYNNLTASGVYQYIGVNLNTPYGSSVNTHFHVVVIRHDDSWLRQIAYDVRTQNCYTRVKTNGTWNAWQQIVLGSDLATKVDRSEVDALRNLVNTRADGLQVSELSGAVNDLRNQVNTKQDAATAINTGNIAGQNVNYATYSAVSNYDQDYGARLRNQALVAADTTPGANGQIFWTFG